MASDVSDGCVGRDHKDPKTNQLCGFQFEVSGGVARHTLAPTAKKYEYTCKMCQATLASNVSDGRVGREHKNPKTNEVCVCVWISIRCVWWNR